MNESALNSLTRVIEHFKNNSFAIISASRGIYGSDENSKRTEELRHDIRSMGYGFVKMKGGYIEGMGTDKETPVHEDVFFIASKAMKPEESENYEQFNKQNNQVFKKDMESLGNKFDQEAIIFKPYGEQKAYILGTVDVNENGEPTWPGKGVMAVAGDTGDLKAGKTGQFHTMLWKNKRKFVFESVEMPKSFFGSWTDFLHKKMISESK